MFWDDLVSKGYITGEAAWYSDGRAKTEAGAYGHAIDVAFKAYPAGSPERAWLVDQLFSQGIMTGNADWWKNNDPGPVDTQNLINAAETGFNSNPTPAGTAGGATTDQGGGVTSSAATPVVKAAEVQATTGVGGKTAETVSILTSPSMKFFLDPERGLWYVSYQLPNSQRTVFFEATGSQMDAVFGEGQRPTNYTETSFDILSKDPNGTFGGDILDMSGTGSFESEVKRTTQLGLDEGKLPKWAQDDAAVMDLVYLAQAEDKSMEWLVDQIYKLPSFKKRFPGIETMISTGLSVAEAVGGFLELETGIKQQMVRAGKNPADLTPAIVGDLLKTGHSLTDVQFVYASFDRLSKNQGALTAFNEVLVARGKSPLSTDDQLAFMEGNAPPELYSLWEEASFQQAATDAGLNVGIQDAIGFANATQGYTGYDEAFAGLNNAAQSILRYRGDLDMKRYGLDQEDMIDLALGIAPRSGRSSAEIGQSMERALQSARAGIDGPRANRFRQFGAEGTPQGVSTSRARAQE